MKPSIMRCHVADVCLAGALLILAADFCAVRADESATPPGPGIMRDIQLSEHGRVDLTLLNAAGKPVADQPVQIRFRGAVIAEAVTDAAGKVSVSRLRPGVHSMIADRQLFALRFWASTDAPPAATIHPAFVLEDAQVRGQYGPGMGPMMGPAVLAAGVTGTALAIVLVGKNSSDSNHIAPASP